MATATPISPSDMDVYVRTTEATDRLVRSVLASPTSAVQPPPKALRTELLTAADLPPILQEFAGAIEVATLLWSGPVTREQQKAALVIDITHRDEAGFCSEQTDWMMPLIEAVVAL